MRIDGRPARKLDPRDFAQRNGPAARQRDEHFFRDRLRIGAEIARIADVDAIALAPFDRRRDRLAAERGGDHLLDIADHQTVARERRAVGDDIEIIAANDALGIGARRAGNALQNGSRPALRRAPISREIAAEDLHADRRANARRRACRCAP